MICLTFDTDHMTEEGMVKFLREYALPQRCTFFLHKPFLFAGRMQMEGKHEVAPHPYIDRLSEWDQDLKAIVQQFSKKPLGLRPHSCVFSHMIGIGMKAQGYIYVSQANNLYWPGLRPFRHPWGIWELPIYYMDNMDFWMVKNWDDLEHQPFDPEIIKRAVGDEALYVFDFHPLHIALNTRTHEDYVSVKERILNQGVSPFDLRFPGRGTGQFFLELCSAMEKAGERSRGCLEAVEHYGSVPPAAGASIDGTKARPLLT